MFILDTAGLILMYTQGFLVFVTFLTVLYPAIHSIIEIQSEDEEDVNHWITYWMIFGFFNFMDTFIGCILCYIPNYQIVRLSLLCWLMLPQFKGAKWLYESFVRDIMENNRLAIFLLFEFTGMKQEEEVEVVVVETKPVEV